VLVADSSKFEISAMVKICGWDAIDSAIIDSAVPDAAAAVLFQNGVKVELV
jgi:DeoR/GlpR family transcriptional regulator of sugar metabolism